MDPVLLAGASVFEKLLSDRCHKKPYILLFTLGRDEYVIPVAKKQLLI